MAKDDTEKNYNELRKRYKLPEFKDIDFEFELSDLEYSNFLARSIIRRIAEKLDFYSTMLEEVLQPDTSNLYALHEIRVFTEEDKRKMYEIYTKMMHFNRQSIEVLLEHNEKHEAEFISCVFNEWANIRDDLLRYVLKMKQSWKAKEADIKEDLGYLG